MTNIYVIMNSHTKVSFVQPFEVVLYSSLYSTGIGRARKLKSDSAPYLANSESAIYRLNGHSNMVQSCNSDWGEAES